MTRKELKAEAGAWRDVAVAIERGGGKIRYREDGGMNLGGICAAVRIFAPDRPTRRRMAARLREYFPERSGCFVYFWPLERGEELFLQDEKTGQWHDVYLDRSPHDRTLAAWLMHWICMDELRRSR